MFCPSFFHYLFDCFHSSKDLEESKSPNLKLKGFQATEKLNYFCYYNYFNFQYLSMFYCYYVGQPMHLECVSNYACQCEHLFLCVCVPVCISKHLQCLLYVCVWACETSLVKSACVNICRYATYVGGGTISVYM